MSADLVAYIERDRLCVDCLAEKTKRPPGEVVAAVEDLARTLRVSVQLALCAGCTSLRSTYKLS